MISLNSRAPKGALFFLLTLVFPSAPASEPETIKGQSAFPDNPLHHQSPLNLTVSLLDVGLADAPAVTITSVNIPVRNNPMDFQLITEADILSDKRSLTLQAVVTDPRTRQVLYRTTQTYPVTEANYRKTFQLKLTNIQP